MENVEFKCELRDLAAARAKCRDLSAEPHGVLEQTDTYFRMPDGRLKRRETAGKPMEWIYYFRPDRVTPKLSHYSIHSDREARTRWGLASLRQWVVVRKKRELFILRNVRIHIDEVEQLGSFLEFEAVVNPKCDVLQCHEQVNRLRREFGPIIGEAIAPSYCDLIDSLRRELKAD